MSAACGSCGAKIPDGHLCRSCGRQLREALADLAPGRTLLPGHAIGPAGRNQSTRWDTPAAVIVGGLADQLDTTITRQARLTTPGKRGKGDTAPTPFHEKGADIRASLRNTLTPWASWMLEITRPTVAPPRCTHRSPIGVDCRTCTVDVPLAHAARRAQWARTAAAVRAGDISAMAAYLLGRVNVIEGQEEAPALRSQVLSAVRRLERIIDREPEKMAAGECGAELDDETVCTRPLYADPAEPYVTCPACDTRWSVADRRAWLLASAENTVANAATISAALTRLDQPVTADRIYQWKTRGRLVQHGVDARGNPMYRLGDVLDLLSEAMAKAARRGTKKAS